MSEHELHRLARDYMKELGDASSGLPHGPRRELLEHIGAHLTETAPAGATEADARAALDRLGDPQEIVAAARPSDPGRPSRTREWFAIGLLLTGFLVVGWLIGLALLLSSRVWTVRDKLIGALVVPGGLWGGLFGIAWIGMSSLHSCSARMDCSGLSLWSFPLLVAWFAAPIASAIYLAVRMRRHDAVRP